MATKVIVIAFLCAALVAVAQSAPQYSQGEEPTYDEDEYLNEPVKEHSSADPAASDDEFDPSLLTEDFANTRSDPGRRPHFLEQDTESQTHSHSDSSSASAEH